jgi:photosystem II stability/assembly factor-like uncharacterized protein
MVGTLLAVFLLPLTGCDSGGMDEVDDGDGGDNPPELQAPTNFDAAVQDDGTVELTWDAAEAADTYDVYRAQDSIENTDASPLMSGVSDTNYTDDTVEDGRDYFYRVTSMASDGSESSLSEQQRVETQPADPSSGGGTGNWTRVKVGTNNTINDIAITSEGAYAVADGGILLRRTDTSWTKVLQGGVSSNGNNLLGLAATDDGERLWLVGASGRIGEWDVSSGSLEQDHSAPNDITNNFQDVAATGQADLANVYVVDGSGLVHSSGDNGGTWDQATPGNGSALRAIDTYDTQSGHLVDGNQSVFETTDGGGSWEGTGIADTDVSLYGVDSDATDDIWVSAGNGTVYRWDGTEWTSTGIGEPDLRDVEVGADDRSGYAAGGGASVFSYDGSAWTRQDTPVTSNLNAVVLGTSSTPPIAVGAGGTVLER